MTSETYAVAFIVSAGLLAVWTDLRFPRLAPSAFGFVVLNMILAAVLSDVAGALFSFAAQARSGLIVPALIGGMLPALVYLLLSSFWLLKLCAGMLPGGGLPGRR